MVNTRTWFEYKFIAKRMLKTSHQSILQGVKTRVSLSHTNLHHTHLEACSQMKQWLKPNELTEIPGQLSDAALQQAPEDIPEMLPNNWWQCKQDAMSDTASWLNNKDSSCRQEVGCTPRKLQSRCTVRTARRDSKVNWQPLQAPAVISWVHVTLSCIYQTRKSSAIDRKDRTDAIRLAGDKQHTLDCQAWQNVMQTWCSCGMPAM